MSQASVESCSANAKRIEYAKWLFSVVLALTLYFIPYFFGISHQGCSFFALTCFAVCLWGFSLLPDGLVAVMLPVSYILAGIGKPAQIFAPWSYSIVWLVFGGFLTGLIIQHTGLARRIALWALYITGGSFKNLLWGLLLAGFIITPMVPTIIGKCILFGIICVSVCDAMGFKAGSKEASIVLIAGFLSVQGPRLAMYTAAGEITVVVEMLKNAGLDISWISFFSQNFIPSIAYSVTSIILLLFVLKPNVNIDAKDWVKEQYKSLGVMSLAEKKAAVLFVVLIALMVTDKYHGINVGWIMVCVGFIGFLPGIELLDRKKFATLNLSPVFFIVGCMSIGLAARLSGMDKELASLMLPVLNGGNQFFTVCMAYITGVTVNFFLTPLAASSIFIGPLVEVAHTLNINPIGIGYSFMIGLDQYLFPYEVAPLLAIFSTGYISLKYLVKYLAWRIVLSFVILCCVFYPCWLLTGAL